MKAFRKEARNTQFATIKKSVNRIRNVNEKNLQSRNTMCSKFKSNSKTSKHSEPVATTL